MEMVEFTVGGMDCASCAMKIEKGLRALPGVMEANVFFASGRVSVRVDPGGIGSDDLFETIAELGFEAFD
jgi:Cu+-exporting ATPase